MDVYKFVMEVDLARAPSSGNERYLYLYIWKPEMSWFSESSYASVRHLNLI